MLLLTNWKAKRERQREEEEYRRRLQNPIHSMLLMMISLAVDQGASAVCIGYRGAASAGICLNPAPQSAEDRLAMERDLAARGFPIDPKLEAAFEASCQWRGPNGATLIPTWLEIDGEMKEGLPVSIRLILYSIAGINDCLVSLNGTPQSPQPRKYLELGVHGPDRRFAEVNFTLESDGAFWIRIVDVCTITPDTHVSLGVC